MSWHEIDHTKMQPIKDPHIDEPEPVEDAEEPAKQQPLQLPPSE